MDEGLFLGLSLPYSTYWLIRLIRPTESKYPKLYGLQKKTHKNGCPTGTILDMINALQYQIAKFFISVLQPVSKKI